jgi:uncharacterized membrane protein required for colicin V production
MKNLFKIILAAMCAVTCYAAFTADNTEAFVYASTAMCLSVIVFLINATTPLIKD